jgi:uncharacterized protein YuzE
MRKAIHFLSGSAKKEAFCKESDIGKEVIYSVAENGSVIGFEILNYLSKGERKPSRVLPVKTQALKAS